MVDARYADNWRICINFYFLRASFASPQVSEIRAQAPCLCPTATFHNVTATDGRD
ncbi:hypothetical protein CES85_1502 [Ochrobactrum quorumnocens]|uniref:Uncharacterized protein n=1 Tax=Ochrobactrum quorumnocens TaxID=271865 RepID=A0A248UGQ4_9HYPH|nr:hypothetical protein CES85_1502 [[Ochrobactrum] quorumnocens]